MKIEPISNGNLRIWLAEEEMEAWEYRNDSVRRLVRRAWTAAGRRPAPRLWAETIPVEGGCVVLVSAEGGRHRQPMVFALSKDGLAEVVARWHPAYADTAQVYAAEDVYWVVLYGEDAEPLLREYGQPLGCGEGLAAHAAEYGEWERTVTAPVPAPPTREDSHR